MGRSLEAIGLYRPTATNDKEATFTDLIKLDEPWHEIFERIALNTRNNCAEWPECIEEYFSDPGDAVVLYSSGADTPKLF